MATQAEIARFYRLALRVGLLDTIAVDRWVDSVIVASSTVAFPFTELAGASKQRREDVDALLGQVVGDGDFGNSGRMVMAYLRRRLRASTVTPEEAVKLAVEIARVGDLAQDEYYKADALDDGLWLARSGTYGDLATVRREVADILESYEKFDEQIPSV